MSANCGGPEKAPANVVGYEYFVRYRPNEFWMLTIYAKAKHDSIPAHILKQLLEAFENE